MLGLCTGLLPAAAAAVAKDLNELLKYGLEIIAVAVRLAQEITLRSTRIEKTPASWAYTIVGATVEDSQAVLERFHQTQVRVYSTMNERLKLTGLESPGPQARLCRRCVAHMDNDFWTTFRPCKALVIFS